MREAERKRDQLGAGTKGGAGPSTGPFHVKIFPTICPQRWVEAGGEGASTRCKPVLPNPRRADRRYFDRFSGLIDGAQARGIQSGITEEIRSADTEATESNRPKISRISTFQ